MAAKKQVFYDISGRRRRYTNIAVAVGLSFVCLSLALIAYTLQKLHNYEQIAQVQNVAKPDDLAVTLLYTDNHAKAYPVTNSQISKIKTVVVPYFQLTPAGVTTPDHYQQLNFDIEFLSESKNVNYEKFLLLSSKNYADQPLDRASHPDADVSLAKLISSNTTAAIVDKLNNTDSKGLMLEIDPTLIVSADQQTEFSAWLIEIHKALTTKNLELGLMITPSKNNELVISRAKLFSKIFINYDYHNPSLQAVTGLVSILSVATAAELIAELPSVSSDMNTQDGLNYARSADFASVQNHLLDKDIAARNSVVVDIQTPSQNLQISDAVASYNYLQSLNRSKSEVNLVSTLQFAIANPGFEEFSLWDILPVSRDQSKVSEMISNHVVASQNVDQHGAGQVYKVKSSGELGKRYVSFGNDGTIQSSKLVLLNKDPVVERLGKMQGKIALTFDDGPHPEYTARILDILDSYNVKGTFFALGSRVRDHPGIAREIVARGHEIENHSYNHPVFNKIDPQSQANQIEATNNIIHEVTGHTAKYFRKPYSDDIAVNSANEVEYLDILQKFGLLSSEYDVDSKDWELLNSQSVVDKVITDIEASNGNYSQILFHDIHTKPQITYEALPKVIEYLQSKGIEIVRVDKLTEQETKVAGATTTYQALKLRDGWTISIIYINSVILLFAVFKYFFMIFGTTFYHLAIKFTRWKLFKPEVPKKRRNKPNLAVIISCYNEEKVIAKTLDAIINGTYKNFKIVVINDGSNDSTLKILRRYAKLDKRIAVHNIPNGGKAAALSYAIRKTKNKWLIFCDADTIFAPNALQEFALNTHDNEDLGAVSGKIVVGNVNNLITRAQYIEYSVSHKFIKTAQDVINSITVVPGAAGMWRRTALSKIGGFTNDTLAEDADATMKVIAAGYRVKFVSNIVAHTEAPESIRQLLVQRTRWQLGNMQALFKHSNGLFRYKYKLLGFVGLPMFFIELASSLFFPVLLVFSVTSLFYLLSGTPLQIPGITGYVTSKELTIIANEIILLEIVISLLAIIREKPMRRELYKLLLTFPYFFFVYKTILSYATIVSLLRALRGTLHGWGALKRTATVKFIKTA